MLCVLFCVILYELFWMSVFDRVCPLFNVFLYFVCDVLCGVRCCCVVVVFVCLNVFVCVVCDSLCGVVWFGCC